ncbi:hypothetical protein Dehly_1283 [Dehalogenimonas lykanthroporepellens BL-DC-9]|nr:hypothetical protein Dehly_1283 [Dehalogenimonas lykanthroporepellens BL-DC-9]
MNCRHEKYILLTLLILVPVVPGAGCTVGSGLTINSQEPNTANRINSGIYCLVFFP